MPVASIPIETIDRNILEKTYFSLTKDIADTIKLPKSVITIMHRDIEITRTDGSTTVSSNDLDNTPTTSSKRRLLINIDEQYNEDDLTTNITHQKETYPIFIDNDIKVSIYPIYVKSDIVIDFTYITPSQSEANRVRDDIRIRLSQTRNIQLHNVEYDILLPSTAEQFIVDVYDLKNRLMPISLDEYFKIHSTNRVVLITDMSNESNIQIGIHEKQIRVPGVFDFNSLPDKIEVDSETGTYSFKFSYKLSLDLPKAVVMRYPIMVCNRPMPSKYLQFIEDFKIACRDEIKDDINYTFYSLYSLSYFESHRQLENRVDTNLPINIPLFDEFNVKEGHKGYNIIVSFLTDIDETDKRTLLNLTQLDEYEFDNTLLNFVLQGEKDFMCKPYMSFFFLGLYQDDRHFDNNVLEVLSDGTVRSLVDLDLIKETRVTLSIITDISMLDYRAIDRLINNLDVLMIFLYEYITVFNNNKTTNIKAKLTDRFYSLIQIIYKLILLDNVSYIEKLFSILAVDKYLYKSLLHVIFNNYPNMFNKLVDMQIISFNGSYTNLYNNFNDNLIQPIRTTMLNHVVALRR